MSREQLLEPATWISFFLRLDLRKGMREARNETRSFSGAREINHVVACPFPLLILLLLLILASMACSSSLRRRWANMLKTRVTAAAHCWLFGCDLHMLPKLKRSHRHHFFPYLHRFRLSCPSVTNHIRRRTAFGRCLSVSVKSTH